MAERKEIDEALAKAELERAQGLALDFGSIVIAKGGWTGHCRPFGSPHAICGKKHPMPSPGSSHVGRAGWKTGRTLSCKACAKRLIALDEESPATPSGERRG
jgi:hypothetical protein